MFSIMKRRTKVAVVAVCTALAVTSVSPASAASAQDLENQAFFWVACRCCLVCVCSHCTF